MTDLASFTLRGRNPDVLTCIANLSNDEVFTPPEFANRMLDTVAAAWAADHGGADIWADPNVRFLDPCTKSGVFLRQIAQRLIRGLEPAIPDLQARVDHILTRQVFGIGSTLLTSLMARRSVYCSKFANGAHSITRRFNSEAGNIWFQRTEHDWNAQDKCKFCGASRATLDRGEDRESHAYAFIHTDNIQARIAEIFGADMQFDVIIGNPPYQLGDGGGDGTSARPIYNEFVEQAKKLNPRYLTMVIPSRWFTGGKGLDEFRSRMLADQRLRSLDDFVFAADVFPNVALKGGVCYFLWDQISKGKCKVTTHFGINGVTVSERNLLEPGAEVFVRFNEGLEILKKIIGKENGGSLTSLALPQEKRFEALVSTRKPFGLDSKFRGRPSKRDEDDIFVHRAGGSGFVGRKEITNGTGLIDKWKVFIGFAAPGTGNKDTYPHRIISTPFIGEPQTVSSETYLCIGPFETKETAESILSYLSCRLTRFLILLHKPSHNTTRKVYTFVPKQDWSKVWTDAELYGKYGLTDAEIAFVEKVVRPMDLVGNLFGEVAVDDGDDD
jgi:site-specific DNA-methyltransferase (adenine-specific)